ncbi:hypothetical protein OROMI_017742 [Orobanche minor]
MSRPQVIAPCWTLQSNHMAHRDILSMLSLEALNISRYDLRYCRLKSSIFIYSISVPEKAN